MTVSKSLRYAVLERGGHTCKSCGRTPPEVKLHVDHVIPVALGGGDAPENLQTLCADCNGAKAATPADAPLIASVATDALRWADAMQVVAERRAAERTDAQARYDTFYEHWNDWYSTDWRGNKVHPELPGAWERSIDQFLTAGLIMDDLLELIRVAMGAKTKDEWKYFCGCCWRRVRQDQEMAAAILEPVKPALLTTVWTQDEVDAELDEAEDMASGIDVYRRRCPHSSTSHCGDPVCALRCAAHVINSAMDYHFFDAEQGRRDNAVMDEAEALLDG